MSYALELRRCRIAGSRVGKELHAPPESRLGRATCATRSRAAFADFGAIIIDDDSWRRAQPRRAAGVEILDRCLSSELHWLVAQCRESQACRTTEADPYWHACKIAENGPLRRGWSPTTVSIRKRMREALRSLERCLPLVNNSAQIPQLDCLGDFRSKLPTTRTHGIRCSQRNAVHQDRANTPRGVFAAQTRRRPMKRMPRCKRAGSPQTSPPQRSPSKCSKSIHNTRTHRCAHTHSSKYLSLVCLNFLSIRSSLSYVSSSCTADEPPEHSLAHPYLTLLPGGLGRGLLGTSLSPDKSKRQCCHAPPQVVWECPQREREKSDRRERETCRLRGPVGRETIPIGARAH